MKLISLEEVAAELTEAKHGDKEEYQELSFSHRLKVLFLEAEHIASVVHAKVLGTDMFSMLFCMMGMP